MGLLSPLSLAWLGLLAPLVVLYILKRRRADRVVGSTLLWELALRDMRAERPWKRLIPHVSLLLQILVIVAGAVALARPAGAGGVPTGALVAVVVDASASMAAVEEGEPRMERARELVRQMATSLPPGGRLMVIEAGAEPTVLAPPSGDGAVLARAVAALSVRGGHADLEAAVAIAAERLRGASDGSRILLLTDAAEDGALAVDAASVPIEVRRVGGESDNTGIVALDVRSRPTEGHPDKADVFVRLARFASTPVDVYLTASTAEGVVASRRVSVEANSTASVVMSADLAPDDNGLAPVVRVELSRVEGERSAGLGDALGLDDLAVAPSPGGRRLPVFLIGDASSTVTRVLRSDPEVELFATSLAALAERDEDEPALDGLMVYLGATPEEPPPGDSVVVAPSGDRVFEVELGEAVANPRIVTWDEEDARLRFITLSDVHLGSIRPVLGPAARTLVSTGAGAAIASIARPTGETTLVSFDPAQTDWPRRPSFVVFFRNLLERARRRRAEGGVPPGTLGEPLRVPAPDGEPVVVHSPDGETLRADSRGGVAIVPVGAVPGVYRVEAGGRERFALRNLLDPAESDVRPRLELTRGGEVGEGAIAQAEEHREAWPWFAGLLLLVLASETLWATRRGAT